MPRVPRPSPLIPDEVDSGSCPCRHPPHRVENDAGRNPLDARRPGQNRRPDVRPSQLGVRHFLCPDHVRSPCAPQPAVLRAVNDHRLSRGVDLDVNAVDSGRTGYYLGVPTVGSESKDGNRGRIPRYSRHERHVYNLIARILRHPAEAQEVKRLLATQRSVDRTYYADLVSDDGTVIASVEKVVYIRKAERSQQPANPLLRWVNRIMSEA